MSATDASSTKKKTTPTSTPVNEVKEVKEPKSRKKRKEPDPGAAPAVDPVIDDSGDVAAPSEEGPKKKRKVVRFDPHNPSSYLNLTHYWKHKEVLRTGLMKAENTKAEAEEKGDEEAINLAENSIKRYAALYERLASRREEVIHQLKVAASLMSFGNVAVPLVEALLGSFSGGGGVDE